MYLLSLIVSIIAFIISVHNLEKGSASEKSGVLRLLPFCPYPDMVAPWQRNTP